MRLSPLRGKCLMAAAHCAQLSPGSERWHLLFLGKSHPSRDSSSLNWKGAAASSQEGAPPSSR